ncbi:metal ABC transporter permease [Shewanella marina]|uniref:metal ABC transporter permease n=1 Tax=Shewanella marina TaxID=487319 RepID=UPI0004710348|nr:metal ABC transporter permease [Shewanella marina]
MIDSSLWSILLPALVAGSIVLSTHVLLGRQVLTRGIIFIDLAIAQIAALGTVVVQLNHELSHLPYVLWWLPTLFALAGAGLIALLAHYFKQDLEALIGGLYVIAAVLAVLLLANDPHGSEIIKQLMSGQILWVSWSQLVLPVLVYTLILILLFMLPTLLSGIGFYVIFAIVITISVQLVGVYLVFSSLIFPALAVARQSHKWSLLYAYIIGLLGYFTGLLLSALFDLPSGAMIVMCLAAYAIVYRMVSVISIKKQD